MRKANRLAVLLGTIGLSIILVSLIRANPNKLGSDAFLEPYGSQILHNGIWAPQKVWLQLTTAGQKINLYILDQNGITQWTQQNTLAPIVTFENISQINYKLTIPTRNHYAILIKNPTNSTIRISLNLTFYDFETDLATIATACFTIGIAVLPAYRIKKLLKKKRRN